MSAAVRHGGDTVFGLITLQNRLSLLFGREGGKVIIDSWLSEGNVTHLITNPLQALIQGY